MINKLDNIKLSLGDGEELLVRAAEKELGKKPAYFRILKKSLDARKGREIKWVYSVEFAAERLPAPAPLSRIKTDKRIIVVGSGPAGLFCAVRLADYGFKPIVIERGQDVDARAEAVAKFADGGALDEQSNVQFGEGGAGTFSDGKLNTQTHSGYTREVLGTFARFGAPAEIEYLSKPHIGSDNLKTVVKNMRGYIISSGGEVRFGTRLVGLKTANGTIRSAICESGGGTYAESCDGLVLAVGHSARDTFEMLADESFAMERREFAVGVRIEHLQEEINAAQYGGAAAMLPPADYKLVSHASKRSCFTFCMCPGGYVMPAASERGGIVTNGMSNYSRDGANANSALLVQIRQADFGGDGILAGMDFQRAIERKAYAFSGSYAAPVQLAGDFMKGRVSTDFGGVKPTYPKTVFADMREVLPDYVCGALKAALPDMAKRLKGFDSGESLLTAPETRFSSPVRILRGANLESFTTANVYPCGEGSGYSGGITSSAADGLRIADCIYTKYK